MKKRGLVTTLMGLLGILFWANPMEVNAETYNWANWSDGPGWYQEWDTKLSETPVFTVDDTLCFYADPDEECREMLENLSGSYGGIVIQSVSEEPIQIGNAESGLKLECLSCYDGVVTAYAECYQVYKGQGDLNLYGDVTHFYLGTSSKNTSGVAVDGTVTVNGDVSYVNWYQTTQSPSDEDVEYEGFAGDCTVTGTVEGGSIYEYFYDDSIKRDSQHKTYVIGSCEAGGFQIIDGVLAETVSTEEQEVVLGNYRFEYQCYGYNYNEENTWQVMVYDKESGSYSFTINDWKEEDVPANADICVYGTVKPLVLEGDVANLLVTWGDVTVNGSVIGKLDLMAQKSAACDITVTGDVGDLYVQYRYNPNLNVTVEGKANGEKVRKETPYYHIEGYFSCSDMQIIKNGEWNPALAMSTTGTENSLAYYPVSEEAKQEAMADLGVGEESTIIVGENEITIVKDANVVVASAEQSVVDALVARDNFSAVLEQLGNTKSEPLQVVGGVDISVETFYANKESGEIYTDDSHIKEVINELSKAVTFTVMIPDEAYDASVKYAVVRSHFNADGSEIIDILETIQNGKELTFASDKFSTFVIVKMNEARSTVSVEWGENWKVLLEYTTSEDDSAMYYPFVVALQDGKQRTRSVETYELVNGKMQYDISPLLRESGQYVAGGYLTVLGEKDGDWGVIDSIQAYTVEKTYTRPDAEMAQATSTWDTTDGYVLNINPVEDASAYYVQLYLENDEGKFEGGFSQIIEAGEAEAITVDYTTYISEGERYKVGIYTLSENVDAVANSVEAFSDILNTRKETTEVENPFGDIKEGVWYYPYVMFAYKQGLMSGKGESEDGSLLFDPANTITRAEFVQMLYAKEEKPAVEFASTFTDVKENDWFASAVIWANKNGIVKGAGDKFNVNGNITRQEMAAILYKYAGFKGYDVTGAADITSFVDDEIVDDWAVPGMQWAVNYGVIFGKEVEKGTGVYELSPTGTAIRAEAATMMKAFMVAYEGITQ